MKALAILAAISNFIGKSNAESYTVNGNGKVQLQDFNKQFFWNKPDEGLYEVDIGL